MLKEIQPLLEKHPELFYLFAAVMILGMFLQYLSKHNQFLKSIISIDYEKKIQKLQATRAYLGKDDKELDKALEDEIESLVFTNYSGSRWPKKKRSDFFRLYALVKDDLNLEEIKLLFPNSSIQENVLSVKITKSTRRKLITELIVGITVLVVLAVFLCLSILVTRLGLWDIIKTIVFLVVSLGMFLFGIYFVGNSRKKNADLKRMKAKYDPPIK